MSFVLTGFWLVHFKNKGTNEKPAHVLSHTIDPSLLSHHVLHHFKDWSSLCVGNLVKLNHNFRWRINNKSIIILLFKIFSQLIDFNQLQSDLHHMRPVTNFSNFCLWKKAAYTFLSLWRFSLKRVGRNNILTSDSKSA